MDTSYLEQIAQRWKDEGDYNRRLEQQFPQGSLNWHAVHIAADLYLSHSATLTHAIQNLNAKGASHGERN